MSEKTFSLDELCALCDLSKRTIRYYMQLGLAIRPLGEARGSYYTTEHLERLLRVKKLTDAGVSLERIREVLDGEESPVPPRRRRPGSVEVRSHLFIAPGLELQITPEEATISPEQIRALSLEIMATAERILTVNKTSH
ncbi:MAG: MerR family transcriptional regulator [Desulfovibrio sp.]|nr:MerR family transcriptional regulator [Desulfovibrio sp.]